MKSDATAIAKDSQIKIFSLAAEAERALTICNACRYCESHCAVFPAGQALPVNQPATLEWLAHLCHSCGACYQHCQYAPPHEFNVHIPQLMDKARQASFVELIRPRLFKFGALHPVMFNVVLVLGCFALFALSMWGNGLLEAHQKSFYTLMPHQTMAGIFMAAAGVVIYCWIACAIAFVPTPRR